MREACCQLGEPRVVVVPSSDGRADREAIFVTLPLPVAGCLIGGATGVRVEMRCAWPGMLWLDLVAASPDQPSVDASCGPCGR